MIHTHVWTWERWGVWKATKLRALWPKPKQKGVRASSWRGNAGGGTRGRRVVWAEGEVGTLEIENCVSKAFVTGRSPSEVRYRRGSLKVPRQTKTRKTRRWEGSAQPRGTGRLGRCEGRGPGGNGKAVCSGADWGQIWLWSGVYLGQSFWSPSESFFSPRACLLGAKWSPFAFGHFPRDWQKLRG